MTSPNVEVVRRAYGSVHADRVRGALLLERLLDVLLGEAINFHDVSARAKSVDSFCGKAAKSASDGSAKYTDPLHQITDQVAARVITYIPEHVDRSCDILRATFDVIEEIDKGELTKKQGLFGYASKHLVLRLDETRSALPENACLAGLSFEVQVRTVVQHAWAEFEHDVRYKYPIPLALKPQFDRSFALAAALLEMADREFTEIDHLYQELAGATPVPTVETAEVETPQPQPSEPDVAGPVVSTPDRREPQEPPPREVLQVPLQASDLPSLLTKRYPNATRSRREHYEAMTKVLRNLDITTVEGLEDVLSRVDSAAVDAAMQHQLPAGHIRRLEDDLLTAFGRAYLEASEVDDLSNRREILSRRLAKLRQFRT